MSWPLSASRLVDWLVSRGVEVVCMDCPLPHKPECGLSLWAPISCPSLAFVRTMNNIPLRTAGPGAEIF